MTTGSPKASRRPALPTGFEIRAARSPAGTRFAIHRGFEAASGARHAFSLRDETGQGPAIEELIQAAELADCVPVLLRQKHSDTVVIRTDPGRTLPPEADAHATADPSCLLVITTADCVPVLVADPGSGAVGAAHAGWRGTSLGIAARLVERMCADLGCRPTRLVALLGPAIGPCCYEVKEDVASKLRTRFPEDGGFVDSRGDRTFLDLAAANARLLTDGGLAAERILYTGVCTACRLDLFPSYRLEGSAAGRLWSVIAPPAGRREPPPEQTPAPA